MSSFEKSNTFWPLLNTYFRAFSDFQSCGSLGPPLPPGDKGLNKKFLRTWCMAFSFLLFFRLDIKHSQNFYGGWAELSLQYFEKRNWQKKGPKNVLNGQITNIQNEGQSNFCWLLWGSMCISPNLVFTVFSFSRGGGGYVM